jgi:hypothetical protein
LNFVDGKGFWAPQASLSIHASGRIVSMLSTLGIIECLDTRTPALWLMVLPLTL